MAKKKASKANKSEGGGKGWLVVLVLLAIGGGWYLTRPAKVLVPRLLGATVDEARELAAKSDLKLQIKEVSSEEKPGTVLSQQPAAGESVARASVVSVEVGKAKEGVSLPNVVGETRSQAEDILRRQGFQVVFKDAKDDSVPIGQVISQDPVASTQVAAGSQVTLTVSAGKKDQAVPELVGLPLELATKLLEERGLGINVQYVAQQGYRIGDPVTVVRTEPAAGGKASPGSKVTVFLPVATPAGGTDARPVTAHAPSLEGLTIAAARAAAAERGITLKLAESASDSSTVTFQDPPPGDPIYGSTPTVVVRVAASAVVPGVAGMNESEARARIERAQLTVGSVKRAHGKVAGEVIGQRPAAGIEVIAGSTVDLVISDPKVSPDTANLPDPLPTPAFTPDPWVD